MMQDPPETPKTKRKKSLLAGAKAYLGVSSKSQAQDKPMAKAQSESALQAPMTPASVKEKQKVRKVNRLSIGNISPEERTPPRERKTPTRRSVEDPPAKAFDDPQTPRAKQKIRRMTSAPAITDHRDAYSVNDISEIAVSPHSVKSKSKRRSSMAASVGDGDEAERGRNIDPSKEKKKIRHNSAGPLMRDRFGRSSMAASVGGGDEAERGRKIDPSKEKKKVRHTSAGPLMRDRVRRSTGLTPKSAIAGSKPRQASLDSLKDQLSALPLPPLEGKLRDPDDTSSRPKTRTTVSADGRIRRVKKKEDGTASDDDDLQSRQSTSSKRSKMSAKSTGTRKSTGGKKVKDKSVGKKKRNSKADYSSSDQDSDHSERSNRSSSSRRSQRVERTERSERRAGKRITSPEDDIAPHESADHGDADVYFDNTALDAAVSPARILNLEEELTRLNKTLVEMKEENLKAQFAAQSEAAKLRKELREEKLELQRSQTERRELRAELRERDLIIDESDRKIKALEKAVESQLDKVDDLEEELRRANEEIFDLEEKLGDMGQVLASSSAVETNALQKEKDFGDKRQERMERRLVEREKELEAREKKLREDREALAKQTQPQREIDQLEQDNRMLLKALNRERAEAADKVKEKDEELKKLRQELKLAKMKSYSQISNGTTNENISKLLQDNVNLQQCLDEEKEKAAAALKERDDRIASLESELKMFSASGESNGVGGTDAATRELEILKADLIVMRSKLEGAQRRNQLLEDDIDHWKSVNCNLEDELAEWKAQVANWRAKHEDVVQPEDDGSYVSEPNILPYRNPMSVSGSHSVAHMALGIKEEEDDNYTTASEPASSIANLWSKLTTPTSKRKTLNNMNVESVNEILARSTFH